MLKKNDAVCYFFPSTYGAFPSPEPCLQSSTLNSFALQMDGSAYNGHKVSNVSLNLDEPIT